GAVMQQHQVLNGASGCEDVEFMGAKRVQVLPQHASEFVVGAVFRGRCQYERFLTARIEAAHDIGAQPAGLVWRNYKENPAYAEAEQTQRRANFQHSTAIGQPWHANPSTLSSATWN